MSCFKILVEYDRFFPIDKFDRNKPWVGDPSLIDQTKVIENFFLHYQQILEAYVDQKMHKEY